MRAPRVQHRITEQCTPGSIESVGCKHHTRALWPPMIAACRADGTTTVMRSVLAGYRRKGTVTENC